MKTTETNKRLLERSDKLSDLGLVFNGESYVKDDINVHWTEIACDTDDEFSAKAEAIKRELNRRVKAIEVAHDRTAESRLTFKKGERL